MITFADLPVLFTDRLAGMRALTAEGVLRPYRALTGLETKVVLVLLAAFNDRKATAYKNREGNIVHAHCGELTHDDIYEYMRGVNGHADSSGSIRRRVSELAYGNYRGTTHKAAVINARELTDHARGTVNVFSVRIPVGYGQLSLF